MFQEGADLYRAGQFALAIKSFDKAIEADPKNGDFWLARAKARQRLGDADWLQAALTDFREAERLLDNGDGLIGQADCLTCSDQHAKAFAIYKEASAKGQRSARVLNNLAAYYIRQGGKADLADADKLLREAANLDSEMQEVGVNQLLLQNKLNKNRNLPRPPFGGSLQVQFVDPLEGRLF
jgi:tetratricopeptide (TPR) repeat protein